jgi:hypothetical protein
MLTQKTKIPGLDHKEFNDAIKDYAKEYDSIVRNKETGPQDTAFTNTGRKSSTSGSLLGFTDEEYRQYVEDNGY